MAEMRKITSSAVFVFTIIAAVVAFAFLLAVKYGKLPPPRTRHETNLLIGKLMGQTDFNNKNSVAHLLEAIKKLPLVEDARYSRYGRPVLHVKFKGDSRWTHKGYTSREGSKRAKKGFFK